MGIFSSKTPDVPATPPPPTPATQANSAAAGGPNTKAAKRGLDSTVLTSSQGASTPPVVTKQLLGQ